VLTSETSSATTNDHNSLAVISRLCIFRHDNKHLVFSVAIGCFFLIFVVIVEEN